jgi:colicin import membrane protein
MKRLFACLAFIACVAHAQQDDDASLAAERARIEHAREKVEAVYKTEEKACYGKFAVNDCLAKARAKRRTAMSDLRRQEIAINDLERKRKAAERQRSIEERNAAAHPPAGQPSDADRQLRADERAADRAKQAASAPEKAAEREKQVQKRQAEIQADAQHRNEQAAHNVKEHEQRLAEAKEREEKMKKRLAERKKPPASSLADPP